MRDVDNVINNFKEHDQRRLISAELEGWPIKLDDTLKYES